MQGILIRFLSRDERRVGGSGERVCGESGDSAEAIEKGEILSSD
jgi:hypothetical protein